MMGIYQDLLRSAWTLGLYLCPVYWTYRLVRAQTKEDYQKQWRGDCKEKNHERHYTLAGDSRRF